MDEWIEILEKAGIPCAPINTIDRVVSHPQILAREMIVSVKHPKVGETKIPGSPIKYKKMKTIIGPAPTLGEHTEEVLEEFLNLKKDEVAKLKEDGVV